MGCFQFGFYVFVETPAVMVVNLDSESLGPARHCLTDPAHADDSQAFALQPVTHDRGGRPAVPIAGLHQCQSFRDASGDRQHQRQCNHCQHQGVCKVHNQFIVARGGGSVGYAAGFQVRRETFVVEPNAVSNLAITPGPTGTGPFSFLAGGNARDEDQTIYALFGELQIPLFENVDVQAAMRYEDYGGEVGSTFDPKVAAKWQVSDTLALRGSAQTSFRGPTLNQLGGVGTTLQFIAPTGAFKAVDQFGNPNLDPESAFSFNLGAIFETGGFFASLDYYNFDFSDPIIVEDQNEIVNSAIAALGARTYRPVDAPVSITVHDPMFSSNCATWSITESGARRVDEPADITVDVDTLSTAYLGAVPWHDLAATGTVDASEDVLDRLDDLFAVRPTPFCG